MLVLYSSFFSSIVSGSFCAGGHVLAQLCSPKLVQPREYCVKHVQKLSQRGVTTHCLHFLNMSLSRVRNFPPCLLWKRYSRVIIFSLSQCANLKTFFSGKERISQSRLKPANKKVAFHSAFCGLPYSSLPPSRLPQTMG